MQFIEKINAKAKYIYFLLEARRKDVTIDASYMIEELDAINRYKKLFNEINNILKSYEIYY